MNCGSLKGWQQHKAANTPPCKWCAPYDPRLAKPKKQVVVRQKPGPKPRKKVADRDHKEVRIGRPPAKCGTPSGAQRHYRLREKPCNLCREATNEYGRGRVRVYEPKTRKVIECGTPQGESLHRRNGETPCDPCRLAYNKLVRDRRALVPKKPRPRGAHGTYAGAAVHFREGSELCQPCRDASNQYHRDARARRKAAA